MSGSMGWLRRAAWVAAGAVLSGCMHWAPVTRGELAARAVDQQAGVPEGTARLEHMVRVRTRDGVTAVLHPPVDATLHAGSLSVRGGTEDAVLDGVVAVEERRVDLTATLVVVLAVTLGLATVVLLPVFVAIEGDSIYM